MALEQKLKAEETHLRHTVLKKLLEKNPFQV